jgi:hypothetical protein
MEEVGKIFRKEMSETYHMSLTSGGRGHFQLADLASLLNIEIKYLEMKSMNSITILVLLETLGFVFKVGTCHYAGGFFFWKNKGLKMGYFPIYSEFLFS